ncbi:MAG: hypothetical protein A2070_05560 [Bdellovibrionales bacterium GWC1_52_8]|nr:MAG: hypothetical protein A2Z97_08940 [Bdellovibrionales bacterium GWB1_52_6]OFZ04885.1 MAG: hypothetical protein A2X97_08840 [Bdellovibrionales bacterium GWA1_52_35]OFZ42328.1 MAG: hypothetical protein A2070_05560 [Bdellovibrionales bacterium GWC1_52_8]
MGLLMGLFIALSTTFLTAPAVQAAPASKGKVFTMRITDEPETLDWNRAHTPIETYILMNIMEGLITCDANAKIAPSLAKSWTISPDGRTYTFHLRTGVKWSDGVPLKAKDFVFSWKRLLSPITGAAYAYFLFDIEGAEAFNRGTLKDFNAVGVKALDDHTLQVNLNKKIAHWAYIPTFWVTFPLREDIVNKFGTDWEKPGRMVSLGPYTMVAHDIDSKIILEKNPYYYGTRGNIDQVLILMIREGTTALRLYETGKLDFLGDISSLDLKRLHGNPELKTFPYLKTSYLGLVANKYPASNPKVRRAVAMAIDKSKLVSLLYGGQKPATSFIPGPIMGYTRKIGLPFDPVKAKQELRAAGFDTGRPLNLELILPNYDKALVVGQFIQNELKKNLGATLVLQPFDNKTFRAQLDLKVFPLFMTSWSADYPDPDNFLSVFQSSAGNNRTLWKNEKYDEFILAARGLGDPKTRENLYSQAQKLLIEEEAVIIPLYYEPNMALVKSRVKGLVLSPMNSLYLKNVNLTN